MTGQQLYATHREYCAAINQSIPAWNTLSGSAQNQWEVLAFEQRLRDKDKSATLSVDRGKDTSYDGPYAD